MTITGRMRAAMLVIVAAGSAAALGAQGAQFRSGVEIVSVYTTVTDDAGRLVPDLRREDFEVYDDGRKQPIEFFSNETQPITIVVMLDCSGSIAGQKEVIRQGATEFVLRLLPNDRARIGNFANDVRISPDDFTGKQGELLDILRRDLQETGPSPVWMAVDRSITAMLGQEGRRVVLIFSDGHNSPARGQIKGDVKDLIHRARFNDVMIYSIGFAAEWTTWSGGVTNNRAPTPLWRPPLPSKRFQPPDPALKDLARETGGGYFEMDERRPLGETFARVADELHRQYWLGFTPTKRDGKTHKIEVKIRRPGMEARARQSYVAPK